MANSNAANPTSAPATMPGLADIQEPLLANDWYLAPGWLLLLFLLLALLSYATYRWWRYRQLQRPVKFALEALAKLNLSAPDAAEQITQLLKRLLMTLTSTHPAVALSGVAWQQYLMTSLPASALSTLPADPLPDLLALHYQQSPAAEDIQRYATFAALWLKTVKVTPGPEMITGATHA